MLDGLVLVLAFRVLAISLLIYGVKETRACPASHPTISAVIQDGGRPLPVCCRHLRKHLELLSKLAAVLLTRISPSRPRTWLSRT